jgi:hypothetical protein
MTQEDKRRVDRQILQIYRNAAIRKLSNDRPM